MLKTRPRKTYDHLMSLPPEIRAELIEGEIYISPSPEVLHQRIARRLLLALQSHAEQGRRGEVFGAPLDVVLSDDLVVQPDVFFVSAERASILSKVVRGAPDLVVEVLSPGSEVRDRVVKRDQYAHHGVREYWIVDPEARTVEVLTLDGAAYALRAVFEAGDEVTSAVLPELRLAVSPLFA